MCTLIALHRRLPGVPLVVAANRDEFLDRPTRGPALRWTANGPIAAPMDERAGGTWLGLNPSGVFAAITNRPSAEPDPRRRSRGLLVLDALAESSAVAAAERLERLEEGAYNPFNLYVADRERACAVTYEERATVVELPQTGVHVIGNTDPNGPAPPKLVRLTERVEAVAREEAALCAGAGRAMKRLAEICRGHDEEGTPLQGVCVHSGAYGTRSSTLLCLGETEADGVFLHAEGAPCETKYDDFTPLLRELGRRARVAGTETARTAS